MDKATIFKGRMPRGYGCQVEELQDAAEKEKEKAQRRRQALDEKWIEILKASAGGCNQSREADRAAEMLRPLWKRAAGGPQDLNDIGDVLRCLIGNKEAAGFYNVNIFNMIVLAADEILGTNAFFDIDPYLFGALATIEEGRDAQLHRPVIALMLDIITVLAERCKKQEQIRARTQKISRNIGYAPGTPGIKKLCCAAQCLQIQCRCYNRNMQSRGMRT